MASNFWAALIEAPRRRQLLPPPAIELRGEAEARSNAGIEASPRPRSGSCGAHVDVASAAGGTAAAAARLPAEERRRCMARIAPEVLARDMERRREVRATAAVAAGALGMCTT